MNTHRVKCPRKTASFVQIILIINHTLAINLNTFFSVIVTFINAWSVSLATKVQNFFTVMKLIAVAVVVVGGAYQLALGNGHFL